jgi:hypothetical protein
LLRRVVWWKFTDVPEGLAVSIIRTSLIALIMEAESTSEASVNFYQTSRKNKQEYSHLYHYF